MNENILIGIIAAFAGALPKIYELMVKKNKDQSYINSTIAVSLAKESKEIRESLKEDIERLVDEIEDLRNENKKLSGKIAQLATENQHLEKENLILRIRVTELESHLIKVASKETMDTSILKDFLDSLALNKKNHKND